MSDQNAKQSLDACRIAGLPPDFYYIPNFISAEEEASILQKVHINQQSTHLFQLPFNTTINPTPSPKPTLLTPHPQISPHRWTPLTHRRLQAHPSPLTSSNTLLASPLPAYLVHPIILRFNDLGIFTATPHAQPNHVLVNEYRPGEGIMPHEDGGAYADVVATVSLGGGCCLDVLPKGSCAEEESRVEGKYVVPTRIFQEARSLLITTGDAYRDLMHGIAAIEVDENLNSDTVANWGLLGDRCREGIEGEGGKSVRATRISLTYRDVVKVSLAASRILGGGGLGRK